jgi:hypothetical protein
MRRRETEELLLLRDVGNPYRARLSKQKSQNAMVAR